MAALGHDRGARVMSPQEAWRQSHRQAAFAQIEFATDSPLEGDGFELPVREHRAMAPSHGFAAASHREAALREAPASRSEAHRGSVRPPRPCGPPICEIRPGENVTLQYLSHDGRPAPRRASRATVRPAAAAPKFDAVPSATTKPIY